MVAKLFQANILTLCIETAEIYAILSFIISSFINISVSMIKTKSIEVKLCFFLSLFTIIVNKSIKGLLPGNLGSRLVSF